MGAWGTGITSSDTFSDIYHDFFDAYNAGGEVGDVSAALEARHKEIILDPDSANEFHLALAKAQWECGSLAPAVRDIVKDMVRSGGEAERWKRLGASEKDVAKRQEAMEAFWEKLSTDNPSPKKRVKKRMRDSLFEKGDCLSIDLKNGRYGGAVAVAGEKGTEYGLNLLLAMEYCKEVPPSLADFRSGKALFEEQLDFLRDEKVRKPFFMVCFAKYYGKYCDYEFSKVGQLPVTIQYDRGNANFMYPHGDWMHVGAAILDHSEGRGVASQASLKSYLIKGLLNRFGIKK